MGSLFLWGWSGRNGRPFSFPEGGAKRFPPPPGTARHSPGTASPQARPPPPPAAPTPAVPLARPSCGAWLAGRGGGPWPRWPGPACSWWGHFSAHDAEASHLFVLVCAASGPPAGKGFSDSVAKEQAIVLRVGTGVAEVYLADLPTPSNPLLKEGQSCRMASTDRDICEPWAIEK